MKVLCARANRVLPGPCVCVSSRPCADRINLAVCVRTWKRSPRGSTRYSLSWLLTSPELCAAAATDPRRPAPTPCHTHHPFPFPADSTTAR